MTLSLIAHLLLPPPIPPTTIITPSSSSSTNPRIPLPTCSINPKTHICSNLLSLALAVTLASPLPSLAFPSFNSPSRPLIPPTTPFSQSRDLPTGLDDNGKIRPCPSINPGCVSSNPKSSSFAFPWTIPDNSLQNAIQQLQQAILETQKNAKILMVEDTKDGQYLQAEVDGGFGRDVLEFLVKGDVVSYRCMATKVTYVYPFTTALGDSKGQEERMKKIVDQLGCYEHVRIPQGNLRATGTGNPKKIGCCSNPLGAICSGAHRLVIYLRKLLAKKD